MERCDASIFAGGGDVRSGECRPGGRYAGPAVSPRQLHRGLTSAKVNWQGFYVGGQVELRLGHFEGGARRQQRPASDASFRPTDVELQSGNRCPTPTATPPALAALSDTIRSGKTSSSASRRTTSMTESARFRIRSGCGYNRRPSRCQSLTHSNAIVKLSDFGSLRVRGGYVMGCFLPYLFAGTGFGSQTVDRTVSAFPYPVLPAGRPPPARPSWSMATASAPAST